MLGLHVANCTSRSYLVDGGVLGRMETEASTLDLRDHQHVAVLVVQ